MSTPKKYPVWFCINSASPKTEVGPITKFRQINITIDIAIDK